MKQCSKCGVEKTLNQFYKAEINKDGFSGQCKNCIRERHLEYKEQNREALNAKERLRNRNKYPEDKQKQRERRLQRVYGISSKQYNELLEKQKQCCAICNKHKDDEKSNFAVDHDHATGEIRGLLCYYCNHRVVGKHRDGALLRKIADYVEQGTGWFVPKQKRTRTRKPK